MSLLKFFGGKREVGQTPPRTNSDRSSHQVEDALPQAVEDQTITQNFYAILESIEEHMQEFYRTENIFANDRYIERPRDDRNLNSTNFTPHLNRYLASLNLPNETSFRLWMTKEVARTVITTISPFENDENAGCFLPQELVDFLEVVEDPGPMRDPSYSSVFGQWKAMSLYLLNHPSVEENNAVTYDEHLQNRQRDIMIELAEKFAGLYDPNTDRRTKHLKQILNRTAKFGCVLWSQVAQFQFDWGTEALIDRASNTSLATPRRKKRRRTRESDLKERRTGRRPSPVGRADTLYMPGLIKLTDHRGRTLNPPKCLLEPRKETRLALTRRMTNDTRTIQYLDQIAEGLTLGRTQ